jgi:hypothetical protein
LSTHHQALNCPGVPLHKINAEAPWENPPLSCALFRAHDKEVLCRAFFIERTTKKKRTAKVLFPVRQKKCTLLRARQSTPPFTLRINEIPLFLKLGCAVFLDARQTYEFARKVFFHVKLW